MQVSRVGNKEELNQVRIDDIKKPITETKFDDLLNQLDIELLDEEKELFQSIIVDRRVSKDELNTLSYEEVKKLKEIVYRSDLDGKFLTDSLVVFESLDMAAYLETPNLSDDDNFNKAVFEMLRELNLSQEEGLSLIRELGDFVDNEEKRDFENRLSNSQYDSGVRYKVHMGKDMQEFISNRLEELNRGLDTTNDEIVKEDYLYLINIYNKIDSKYNSLKQKDEAYLQQYTRDTKPNPIYNQDVINLYNDVVNEHEEKDKKEFEELLKKLEINNLSQDEKEKFRLILEDKEFSNIEMDSLSYEQMKKITQLISQKDSNNIPIEGTSVTLGSRTSALLKAVTATDDDSFNKALFEKVKSFSTMEEINNFLLPILHHIDEQLKRFDEMIKLNMDEVLNDLINGFKEEYDKAEHKEIKEHYESVIEEYSDFKEFYEKIKKEDVSL
ncbi:hypothetical protein [Halarcobacter sp.]|uniref:hypothetical protein n=1 Tax=Halarcobacter sp. TaxID=2321133 RepID=UPI003A924E3D